MRQYRKLYEYCLHVDFFFEKSQGATAVIIKKILSVKQKRHPLLMWSLIPPHPSGWCMFQLVLMVRCQLAPAGPTPWTLGYCDYFHPILSCNNLSLCSMGTRKNHVVVVSVQYLYWASLVASAKGICQGYRHFLLFCSVMCLDWFVPLLFVLFSVQYFISKTLCSSITSCISLCQDHGGACCVPFVRSELLYREFNKAQ